MMGPARTVVPRAIRLEASSFCQLRCPSCPTTTRAIHPVVGSGFLELADFRRLLDANPQLRAVELSNYGEILLNPELLAILALAHERGVALRAENGVNLNHARPEVLEGLVKYQVRRLGCSIDGASPETYARYRVGGDFAAVIANVEAINRWKRRYGSPFPMLAWQFIVFGYNEHEIPQARALARKLGMDFGVKLSWDPAFSPVRDRAFVRGAGALGAATRADYRGRRDDPYGRAICHQLWEQPQINWDGKVLGCCRNFWGEFGGNAFTDGLEAAVNSERMRHARAMLVGDAPARDDVPCTTCAVYLSMRAERRWLRRDLRALIGRGVARWRRQRAEARRARGQRAAHAPGP